MAFFLCSLFAFFLFFTKAQDALSEKGMRKTSGWDLLVAVLKQKVELPHKRSDMSVARGAELFFDKASRLFI
jgi:hypothetical protein